MLVAFRMKLAVLRSVWLLALQRKFGTLSETGSGQLSQCSERFCARYGCWHCNTNLGHYPRQVLGSFHNAVSGFALGMAAGTATKIWDIIRDMFWVPFRMQ
jgi:hypothetical protein